MDIATVLQQAGVVGVLRAPSPQAAVQATLAAAAGGLKAIEITYTTPNATQAIAQLAAQKPSLLLGAGTVMTLEQGVEAINAGAQFLVSPHLEEDLIKLSLATGVPYVPGVLSATEIVRAMRLGAQAVKIFPIGSAGGIPYLKDLLGPLPQLKAMVTGGVSPAQVSAYRSAGALAVGLGSNLFPKAAITAQDWAAVQTATTQAIHEAGL